MLSRQAPANQNQPGASWARTSETQKFAISAGAAETRLGVAWSLNLSSAREKRLLAAAANGNDPARQLSQEINRQFRKRLSNMLPYSFKFEFDAGGRLHAHGVVIPDSESDEHLWAIREALAHAGGKIKGQSGSTQVDVQRLYYAAGWCGYLNKTHRPTARRLGTEKIIFISDSMRRIAREFHESKLARPRRAHQRQRAR